MWPIVACISKQNGIPIEFTKGQTRKLYWYRDRIQPMNGRRGRERKGGFVAKCQTQFVAQQFSIQFLQQKSPQDSLFSYKRKQVKYHRYCPILRIIYYLFRKKRVLGM